MSSIHAHKILNMMSGNSYTEATLLDAIHTQFGPDARFHTCSAENMNAQEIIVFLKQKGKFMPVETKTFTVDKTKTCDHSDHHHHHDDE